MKKEDAINLLKGQIGKLNSDSFDYKVWNSETATILDNIFGDKAESKKNNLNGIRYFNADIYGVLTETDKLKKIQEGKDKALKFMNIYIGEISSLGFQNSEKTKKMNLLKNGLFWTIAITFVGGSFTLGLYIGQAKFDKEKIEMFNKNQELLKQIESVSNNFKAYKDSISISKHSIKTIK
jgi:hypothetical protein